MRVMGTSARERFNEMRIESNVRRRRGRKAEYLVAWTPSKLRGDKARGTKWPDRE
jgi:hypothetical protein